MNYFLFQPGSNVPIVCYSIGEVMSNITSIQMRQDTPLHLFKIIQGVEVHLPS